MFFSPAVDLPACLTEIYSFIQSFFKFSFSVAKAVNIIFKKNKTVFAYNPLFLSVQLNRNICSASICLY